MEIRLVGPMLGMVGRITVGKPGRTPVGTDVCAGATPARSAAGNISKGFSFADMVRLPEVDGSVSRMRCAHVLANDATDV
ncbi:hypothetical protein [Variovorax sp. 770b2]|uniref:hypothetical protein n=1 Tax=Variovorax sp. 770b2 TaxID=1566271 RepID=UPI00210E7DAE|nr:hypothetical protein [Variovorax sp. 770b2]